MFHSISKRLSIALSMIAAAGQSIAQESEQVVPDTESTPDSFFTALTEGKVKLNNRFRVELADTTGRDSSTAITNRLRLGYETRRFHGFQGYIEMENVSTFDESNYFVPATGDGSASRTVVADPTGTEVNQAYVSYMFDDEVYLSANVEVIAGRQRIIFDDSRFIGNIGWRQFEQTFDAVRLKTTFDDVPVRMQYAFVWRVNRIFGPNGPNNESASQLINLSYEPNSQIRVTPFAYLLDFRDDSPRNSVNSYGLRLDGELWNDADAESDLSLDYEATFAYQTDAGQNPRDYEALFAAGEAKLSSKGVGAVGVGYQYLGSDGGTAAFVFPLGTNHKFQGFADQFLATPDFGLQDLYISGTLSDVLGVQTSVIYHQFWSDEGGIDLGNEIDFVAKRRINKHMSGLIKGGVFDGHNGQPDTTRFWAQTTITF